MKWLSILVTAFLYYIAARVGFSFAFEHTNVSPVWPPSGLAFAILLLGGKELWPGVMLGAFVANLIVFLDNQNLALPMLILISIVISIGNTLEAVVGAWLFKNVNKSDLALSSSRDAFNFLAVTLLMCVPAALIGVSVLVFSGVISAGVGTEARLTWWLGDVVGILLLTPLVLWWRKTEPVQWSRLRIVEFITLTIISTILVWVVFSEHNSQEWVHSLPYLLIPPIVWASFRFDQRETTVLMILISAAAIGFTTQGSGPFVSSSLNHSLLLLQSFVFVLSTLCIILTATVTERRSTQIALQRANDHLELRVTQRTQELEKTNQHLIEFDQLKFTFLASLSHELRTPMNAILGFTNLVLRGVSGNLNTQQESHLGRAYAAAQHLMSLLRDVVDLSKLEIGRLDVATTNFELKPALSEVIDELDSSLQSNSVATRLVCSEGIEMRTDKRRLQQCISNLIVHAISAERTIEIRAEADQERVTIAVSDNGENISPELLSKVFEAFEGEGTERRFRTEATGLALHITQRVTKELLRGNVAAQNEPGKGCIFTMTIPRIL